VGVYPSTPERTVQALKLIMNRSDSVSVRDRVSQEFLEERDVRNVRLVDDPATKLRPDGSAGRELLDRQGVDTDGELIGIAARRVLDRNINDRLQATYRTVAEELVDRGYEVVFIPFCRHGYEPVGKDHQVCEILAEQIDASTVVSYEGPQEALDTVAAFDGLLATRLHSMIFAVVAETPHTSIMYAPKVRSLLTQFGMADQGVELEEVSPQLVMETLDEYVLRVDS
jgi:polysaccharide pyruvyl transferase WcaK-like protein